MIRSLTSHDAADLDAFTCARIDQPWTVPVQRMVRHELPRELERGTTEAAGVWEAGDLRGVAAWRHQAVPSPIVKSDVLAVDVRWQRLGVGSQLKRHVIDVAQSVSAFAVMSRVHWDNIAMLRLNERLGGRCYREPEDDEYALCIIRLR